MVKGNLSNTPYLGQEERAREGTQKGVGEDSGVGASKDGMKGRKAQRVGRFLPKRTVKPPDTIIKPIQSSKEKKRKRGIC